MITYRYYDDTRKTVMASDGRSIPADIQNSLYRELVETGTVIEDAAIVPTSVNDVREEAQRRIVALTGARDVQSCLIKQLNALMRATELTSKRALGGAMSDVEAAESVALKGLADKIKAIRASSNLLESKLPDDYTDDKHWP